ncbi:MAG: vWA domain-containing protein [Candidatus Woesearchaeota archaeon]
MVTLSDISKVQALYLWVTLLIIPLIFIISFIIRKNFVKFNNKTEKKIFNKERKLDRFVITLSRIIIFSLLLLGLASFFDYTDIEERGDPNLKILVDRSGSFNLFQEDIAEEIKKNIGDDIPITIVDIESGNRSAIGSAIRNNMQGNDNLLIITDAYSNEGWDLGDAVLFAQNQKTVINALDIKPLYDDHAVIIQGPSQVIQESENEFFITVNQVGQLRSKLTVTVDNEEIINSDVNSEKVLSFKKSFDSGDHKIIARLENQDYFEQNNIYYKTVHVVQKPKLLLVTKESSPLKTILSELYDITVTQDVQGNLENYHMVVIDDISEEQLNSKVNALKEYIDDGNGLLMIGGKNTFEFNNDCNPAITPSMQNCLIQTLLPTQVGFGGEEEFKDINIIFLIDISGSTGESFSGSKEDTKVAVEKALALELLKDMKLDYRVAVVAFNTRAIYVASLKPLFDHPNINRTIAQLEYKGGTIIFQGLRKVHELFQDVGGSKNVILISDGNTNSPQDALNKAEAMANDGITITALGVGENTNSKFMALLAEKGNGVFYQPNETEKIKISLELGEDTDTDKYSLEIMNSNTFITNDIELDASVTGFNQVVPKRTGRVLVATEKNSPILTTWRFGLGRVAVLSTDNGNKWSGQLYSGENSELITRTINWLVGDPDRVKQYSIRVKDTNLGEPTDISIISEKMPGLTGYEFSKVELGNKDLYTSTFNPTSTGIFKFDNTIAAVNYHQEYQRLGINPDLKTLIESSGGGFFKPEESKELVEKVRQDSVRIRTDYKFFRWPFIIAALIILILEIGFRRFRENYLMSRR